MTTVGEPKRSGARSIFLVLAMTWIVALEPAAAQIYEWHDAQGRHFADSLESVPEAARSGAKLVIEEATPVPGQVQAGDAGAAAAVPDTTRPAEPDAYAAGWDAGFRAGWDAGFRAGTDEQPVCPAEPETVVLQSQPPVIVNVPRYDPTGAYYVSPYGGTVTVPFDQGRSRGLTRREQMQRLQGR